MTIRVINATFESASSADFNSVDDAYRAAIVAGLGIASDEVAAGSDSAIVQVSVDVVGQSEMARGAVAVSTARLMTAALA